MVDVEGEHITVRLGTHTCYPPDDDDDDDGDGDDGDGDDDATHLAFVSRQISPKYEPSLKEVATYKIIATHCCHLQNCVKFSLLKKFVWGGVK